MVYRPLIDNNLCFVLMPFKNPFNGYYTRIIKPALTDIGLMALRSDEIYGTRPIIRDIWDSIWQARIVVADVTGRNPNVNYELGICHTLGVPTVLITKKIEDVPFDYQHRRCIVYQTDEAGWEDKLRENLTRTIKNTLEGLKPDEELPWPYDTAARKETRAVESILVAEDSREIVIQGARRVQEYLIKAFGPNGTHVSIPSGMREQIPQRRGTTITQAIGSTNPLEGKGIEEMRRVALEVYSFVGDSSKTAVLLACAMLEFGQQALTEGYSRKDVVRGMKRAVDTAARFLSTEAKRVTPDELFGVAATAANDKNIAPIVIKALEAVGPDGEVSIEESDIMETRVEITEGLQIKQGYLSPYFITDAESGQCILDECYILILEGKVSSMRDLLPLLEQIAKVDKPLLILAQDVEGEALATMVVNKTRGTLKCAAVRTVGYGERLRTFLVDIAVLTGGRAITVDLGLRLESISINDLGRAKKVVIDRETTRILGAEGSPDDIEAHVRMIRSELQETQNPTSITALRERLINLAGKIAVIHAGGASNLDVIDEKYKIESAIHACLTSIEEGWLVGGGKSLLNSIRLIEQLVSSNKAEAIGMRAVSRALERPTETLIKSVDHNFTQTLLAIQASESDAFGFNVETGQLEDLVNSGVLDSARALRKSVEIAFSHAKAILQTSSWDLSSIEPPNIGRGHLTIEDDEQ